MLASPGHSPRHIVSSTPSSNEQDRRSEHDGPSSLQLLVSSSSGRFTTMGPPPRRRKRPQKVVDEDSYVAAIEKIVERDFFPDIPKLQDRLELLEATRSGDPILIREAQMNIIQRRRMKSQISGTPTSVSDPFDTPNSMLGDSPGSCMRTPSFISSQQGLQQPDSSISPAIDTSLSLDEFLMRYTSEDNASFSSILDKVNKKRYEKYKYLCDEELVPPHLSIEERGEYPTDGFGSSNQPLSTLEGWGYKAKNLLMYDSAERDDAPLTQAEKEQRLKSLSKEINIRSTRFHGKISDLTTREEDAPVSLYPSISGATPMSVWDSEKMMKKYDLEDLRKTPVLSEKEANKVLSRGGTSGYSYVVTPSPAPGVDESPFMTWGEIDGTPMRLEEEDTPIGIGGNGDGPRFKIPAPPSRDVRAHSLSRDAARNLREKSRLFSGSSPSPARGSDSPALKTLSAAAQNFLKKAMAKSSASVDINLRASYRSPGTPRMARNSVQFREGSISSRAGSVPLQSPAAREGSVPLRSP